jgi:hypothetical protein
VKHGNFRLTMFTQQPKCPRQKRFNAVMSLFTCRNPPTKTNYFGVNSTASFRAKTTSKHIYN